MTNYSHQDIALVKPSPIQAPHDTDCNDGKVELYSDIESLGDDNKDDDSENELIIDDNNARGSSNNGTGCYVKT